MNSPTFKGGLWDKNGSALVDPARLVWGLKSVAERLGVRIYEDTKATNLEQDGVGVLVTLNSARSAPVVWPSHKCVQATTAAHLELHRSGL